MLNDIKQALEKLGYKAYYGRSLAKPMMIGIILSLTKVGHLDQEQIEWTITNIIRYILFVKII